MAMVMPSFFAAEPTSASATTSAEEVGNRVCPVSGEKIKEGEEVKLEHEGKIYNFCCKMCFKDFKKDPQKYIKLLQEITRMDFHLHPMVIHFPVALFISALLFEIVSVFSRKEILHQTAVSIYTLAVAAVPFAVITGLWEAEEWNLTNHKVFLQHRNFAFLTLGVSLISFFIVTRVKKQPRNQLQRTFFLALLILSVCVALTAFYGGQLVYEYGIGVEEE